MKVAVRADAGAMIGTGHVMRCLTLADALASTGASVTFICRAHPGHLHDRILARGHDCRLLPVVETSGEGYAPWLGAPWPMDAADTAAIMQELGSVGLLIADHYAINGAWHRALRPHAARIMVIDDLADRVYDADVLLDQNFGRGSDDYTTLVSQDCRLLTGPKYALLRPEFAAARADALCRRASFNGVRRVLVSLGGADPGDVTEKVLRLLAAAKGDRAITVTVVVADDTTAKRLRAIAQAVDLDADIIAGAGNMAALMTDADVAIGGVGGTAWERCALGLPTLALVLADNQRPAAERMKAAGLVIDAIIPAALDEEIILRLLNLEPRYYSRVSLALFDLCDGGGAARVAGEVLKVAA